MRGIHIIHISTYNTYSSPLRLQQVNNKIISTQFAVIIYWLAGGFHDDQAFPKDNVSSVCLIIDSFKQLLKKINVKHSHGSIWSLNIKQICISEMVDYAVNIGA